MGVIKRTPFKKNKDEQRHRSTQMDTPIEELIGGCVVTKDNRLVKIIEIRPIQLFNKTVEDQNDLISQFAGTLGLFPNNFQFTCMTFPTDLSYQIRLIDDNLEVETNENCRDIGEAYKRKLMAQESIGNQRRFFITIESDKHGNFLKGDKLVEAVLALNNQASLIVDALNNMRNIECVPSVDLVKEFGINIGSLEILYKVLNRDSKLNVFGRMSAVNQNYRNELLKAGVTNPQNYVIKPSQYLAPYGMIYTNKKYIKVNNTFYSFMYLAPNGGYNEYVFRAWLAQYALYGKGIDVNVYFQRIDSNILKNKLKPIISHAILNANTNGGTTDAYAASSATLSSANYLMNGLRNDDKAFDMAVMVTFSGSSIDEVDDLMDGFLSRATQNNNIFKPILFQAKEAFNSALPLARMDKIIFNKAKINVLTEGVASTYPFVSEELFDRNGIWIGKNTSNDSLVAIDIFDSTKYHNANMFCCGAPGSGKTFTLCVMAMRMRIQHIQVFIIAPEKQEEFYLMCNQMGGQYIDMSLGAQSRINIMEIRKEDESARETDEVTGKNTNVSKLKSRIDAVSRFIRVYYKIASNDVKRQSKISLLNQAIERTYARFGFTNDNESLFDPDDETHTKYRTMPILADLVETIHNIAQEKEGDQKDIMGELELVVSDIASQDIFNGQTNVDLSNQFILFGISELDGEFKPLALNLLMDVVASKAKEDTSKRKAIFIDEVWALTQTPETATFLLRMAKLVRSWGGGMLLFTQQMSDLMKSYTEDGKPVGEQILGCCESYLLMNMTRFDVTTTQSILRFPNSVAKKIMEDTGRGNGTFIANNESTRFHVDASEEEMELIQTDPVRRAKYKEKMLEKKKFEKAQDANLAALEWDDGPEGDDGGSVGFVPIDEAQAEDDDIEAFFEETGGEIEDEEEYEEVDEGEDFNDFFNSFSDSDEPESEEQGGEELEENHNQNDERDEEDSEPDAEEKMNEFVEEAKRNNSEALARIQKKQAEVGRNKKNNVQKYARPSSKKPDRRPKI